MYIDNYLGKTVRLRGKCAAVGTSPVNLAAMNAAILYGNVAAAAAKLDVSSSSALDTAASGTGAQKIAILGLDANYNFQAEMVSLNGTTIVTTAKSFLRVFAAEVLVAGTGFVNAGTIYIVVTGTGGTYSTPGVPGTLTSAWLEILTGESVGTSGIFTVPAGLTYSIKKISGSAIGDAASFNALDHRPTVATDNAFKPSIAVPVANGVPVSIDSVAPNGEMFIEKTDIYLRGAAATTTAALDGTVWLDRLGGYDRSSTFLLIE